MTEQEYKEIEFYLYNYHKINLLIKEWKMDLIDSINVSNNAMIYYLQDKQKSVGQNILLFFFCLKIFYKIFKKLLTECQ